MEINRETTTKKSFFAKHLKKINHLNLKPKKFYSQIKIRRKTNKNNE